MEVHLPKELLAAEEYQVYVIDDFLVKSNLVADDPRILNYSLVVELTQIYLGVHQVAVDIVKLVEIERTPLIGHYVEEKPFFRLGSGVSRVVPLY